MHVLRRSLLVASIAFAGLLSCHRNESPAPVAPQAIDDTDAAAASPIDSDAGVSLRIIDAGEPELLSPMVEHFAIDGSADFRVVFAASGTEASPGWAVAIDGSGKALIRVDSQPYAKCTTKQLDSKQVTALTSVVRVKSFFALKDFYAGVIDSGSTRVSIHLGKKKKIISHLSSLGTMSPPRSDEGERRRIEVTEKKIVEIVGDWSQLEAPKTFCPADVASIFDAFDR
jgi:hypothetical protein